MKKIIKGDQVIEAQIELLINLSARQKAIAQVLNIQIADNGISENRLKEIIGRLEIKEPVSSGVQALESYALDLLIDISANLKATENILARALASYPGEEDEIIRSMNDNANKFKEDIENDQWAKRGFIDMADIIQDSSAGTINKH